MLRCKTGAASPTKVRTAPPQNPSRRKEPTYPLKRKPQVMSSNPGPIRITNLARIGALVAEPAQGHTYHRLVCEYAKPLCQFANIFAKRKRRRHGLPGTNAKAVVFVSKRNL